jgi:hypothetical protein
MISIIIKCLWIVLSLLAIIICYESIRIYIKIKIDRILEKEAYIYEDIKIVLRDLNKGHVIICVNKKTSMIWILKMSNDYKRLHVINNTKMFTIMKFVETFLHRMEKKSYFVSSNHPMFKIITENIESLINEKSGNKDEKNDS